MSLKITPEGISALVAAFEVVTSTGLEWVKVGQVVSTARAEGRNPTHDEFEVARADTQSAIDAIRGTGDAGPKPGAF